MFLLGINALLLITLGRSCIFPHLGNFYTPVHFDALEIKFKDTRKSKLSQVFRHGTVAHRFINVMLREKISD